jgi:hypothetical protein
LRACSKLEFWPIAIAGHKIRIALSSDESSDFIRNLVSRLLRWKFSRSLQKKEKIALWSK